MSTSATASTAQALWIVSTLITKQSMKPEQQMGTKMALANTSDTVLGGKLDQDQD
jgi:hypothetical protein